MFCGNCGFQIPDGIAVCPGCGKASFAPDLLAQRPEAPASRPPVPPTLPATNYGASQNAYGFPPPSPGGTNPYERPSFPSYTPPPYVPPYTPAPTPYPPYLPPVPPPPAPRGNRRLPFIIGGILAALILLCGASAYLFSTLNHTGGTNGTNGTNVDSATPSPTDPNQNPYPPKTGTLVMSDPMHDNSKGYKWDEATMNTNNSNSFCGYKLGNYHVSRGVKGSVICDPEAPQLTLNNLAFEANLTITQGSDAGLAARFDQIKGVGYLFGVTIDGRYYIDSMDLNNADANKHFVALREGSNGAIKQGLNQSNLLAFVLNGNSISVFVNNQFIDSVQDTKLSGGQLGIYGYSDNGLDLFVQNARAWRI